MSSARCSKRLRVTLGGRHVLWVSGSILEAGMNSTRGRFDTCLFVEAPATDVHTSPLHIDQHYRHTCMYCVSLYVYNMSYADYLHTVLLVNYQGCFTQSTIDEPK